MKRLNSISDEEELKLGLIAVMFSVVEANVAITCGPYHLLAIYYLQD